MLPDVPLYLLDYAGVLVFAATGALAAARGGHDLVTFAFFAAVTGIGGGTLRDLLIGAPVFWVRDPWVAPVILLTALVAWFTPGRWWKGRLLDWADAVGLAVYSTLGTAKALSYGVEAVPAVLMGIVTGCVGGIIRDVLAGQPSILMRPELYVTAAALSAALCAAGTLVGLPLALVWGGAALAGFALRGAALVWQIELPPYSRET